MDHFNPLAQLPSAAKTIDEYKKQADSYFNWLRWNPTRSFASELWRCFESLTGALDLPTQDKQVYGQSMNKMLMRNQLNSCVRLLIKFAHDIRRKQEAAAQVVPTTSTMTATTTDIGPTDQEVIDITDGFPWDQELNADDSIPAILTVYKHKVNEFERGSGKRKLRPESTPVVADSPVPTPKKYGKPTATFERYGA